MERNCVLSILATRPQVMPELGKRTELEHRLGVPDLSYADERIERLGEREDIPVTSLAPALAAYALEHHVYLNGFTPANLGAGHWNEVGHQVAAEKIAADLCKAFSKESSSR